MEPQRHNQDAQSVFRPTVQGIKQGFSVFRLFTRLRRPLSSPISFERPRRSVDRRAQEWWSSYD